MPLRTGRVVICAAALAWCAAWACADTLDDVLGAIEQRGAQIRSMSCTMRMEMDVLGKKATMTGEMWVKAPGKISIESTTRAPSPEGMSEVKVRMVSNGEVMWQEVHANGQLRVNRVNLASAGLSPEDIGMGPGMSGGGNAAKELSELRKKMDLQLREDTVLGDGQKAWVIDGRVKPGALGAAGVDADKTRALAGGMKVFVAQADGVIRRIEFLSSQGAPTGAIWMENVKVNAPISDAVFSYSPPANVSVNDLTEMVRKSRGAAKSPAAKGETAEAAPRERALAPVPAAKVLAPGTPAPEFLVTTLDGETVELAKLRGRRVLVFFFAAWSPGSVSKLVEADKLAAESGVATVALSLDEAGAAAKVRQLAADKGLAARVALGNNALFNAYLVSRVPTYALVDAAGKVVLSEADPQNLGALKAALKK